MSEILLQLALFSAKAIIVGLLILMVIAGILVLLGKGKEKLKGRITIKNLNDQYAEMKEMLLVETMSKKQFKKFLKERKKTERSAKKSDGKKKNIYVLHFHGDMKASAAEALSEEITAILTVASKHDEVVLRLESPGGIVHSYGLAAAQLMRLRAKQIPLTVTVDKIAASGGYLMASVADKILASPFATIGSIGVVAQLPNFHRLLKNKHIDFELHTAGEFKRTITLFGENTTEGKEKLQEEIEAIHQQFKASIMTYRPQMDIQQVATGETWMGQQALALKLVDEIKTSDDYLLEQSSDASLYEIIYETKKPLLARLSATASIFKNNLLWWAQTR